MEKIVGSVLVVDKLPSYIISVVRLIINPKAREWCKLPYPGHPNGCPVYGTREKCPPLAPSASNYFDLTKPLFLVYSEFDLEAHAIKMKENHPDWSKRQCRCVLYWQPRARKQLKERIFNAIGILGTMVIATVPEAMGVNVYATCALSGLKLEKIKDLKIDRHIALLGYSKQKQGLFY